jgi:hypothetical protein
VHVQVMVTTVMHCDIITQIAINYVFDTASAFEFLLPTESPVGNTFRFCVAPAIDSGSYEITLWSQDKKDQHRMVLRGLLKSRFL